MKKHHLTLVGKSHGEVRVSAATLQETLGALLDSARLATRFMVDGQSRRSGPRPSWLEAACGIDVTGLKDGSTVIAVEAPTMHDADPARFSHHRQPSLFEEADASISSQTAIDIFGIVLASALEKPADAVLADRPLLDACARFARAGGSEYSAIKIDGVHGRTEPLIVERRHIPILELLRDETPPPQAARVAGVLDTISVSRSDIVIRLRAGTRVPARLDEHAPDTLKNLFGRQVVASGMAQYSPSGRLLVLDVESIEEAGRGDKIFETMPVARTRRQALKLVNQDDSPGVAAFFGVWPGDETDQELLDALKAIG